MQAYSILATYSAVLVAAVLMGGNLPRFIGLNHTRVQLIMSLVSGLMLGVAIFHLMPHSLASLEGSGRYDQFAIWLMAGLLVMFLLLRVFHFHHHDLAEDGHETQCVEPHHPPEPDHVPVDGGALGWIGIAIGLTLHTVIDGIALAASMQADVNLSASEGSVTWLGLGVFAAILLHKPLDALTITAMMERAGHTAPVKNGVVLCFALICPVTAMIVLWGMGNSSFSTSVFVGIALAFSAGVFLCIALSDLLPEIHFHSHDRLRMTAALLLGIILSWLIHFIETDHLHRASDPAQAYLDHTTTFDQPLSTT